MLRPLLVSLVSVVILAGPAACSENPATVSRKEGRGHVAAFRPPADLPVDDFGRAEIRGPGGEVRAVSAVGCAYGFQGRRLDAETGLLYFRARMYDPATGRFLQRDPVWDAGNVGGQYTFCGNGPVSGRDPSGTLGVAEALVEVRQGVKSATGSAKGIPYLEAGLVIVGGALELNARLQDHQRNGTDGVQGVLEDLDVLQAPAERNPTGSVTLFQWVSDKLRTNTTGGSDYREYWHEYRAWEAREAAKRNQNPVPAWQRIFAKKNGRAPTATEIEVYSSTPGDEWEKMQAVERLLDEQETGTCPTAGGSGQQPPDVPQAPPGAGDGGDEWPPIPGRPFRGPNAPRDASDHLQKHHGLDPNVAMDRLHKIKENASIPPNGNVVIGKSGEVYNEATNEQIGNLLQR